LNPLNYIRQLPNSAKTALLIFVVAKLLVFTTGYIVTLFNGGSALDMFSRWDASNYVSIAKYGYLTTGEQAYYIVFFPLYPLLIRAFTWDFAYINLTALVVANVCSFIAALYLYKLAKLEFGDGAAVKAVLFLSVFPTAYFLSAPYTEGLFFALIIACFYYARLGSWKIAGLLGFFASLTRLAGLVLLPALLVEYYHQVGWNPKKTRIDIAFVFSALAGFLIYLAINNTVTGDPFTFMSIEASHWNNRFDPISGLQAAWWWALNRPPTDGITIGSAPIAFGIFGLVMIGAAVWKRFRPSYIVYMVMAWGIAVSTSWWISVPRYIMAMFPVFLVLATLTKRKAVNAAIVAFSVAWLVFFTVLFALGWWAF
jgi:hypothetical protein